MIGHCDDEYDEGQHMVTQQEERGTQILHCWDCRYEKTSAFEYPCKGCTGRMTRWAAKEETK